MSFGWAGKILYINLTNETIYTESTKKYTFFIGGRGINQWLLFKLVDKDVEPLEPENVIILGSGPLVGTLVPGANRLAVDFKNVITDGVGSGNCGGQFAAEMKFAGYDNIIILGKAEKPIYLFIKNDEVYFRDCSNIWGKSTWETENIIKKRENDKAIKTLTIGLGGENLVKFACLIGDRGRAVGYGGSGAIFGSKNLKAIAIRGTLPIKIAYPRKILEKVGQYNKNVIEKSKAVEVHRKGGTLLAYLLPGENRPHGVKNMSEEFWSNEDISMVTRDKFDNNYLKRRHSCFNCPVYCSGIYEINGLNCEGFQANSFRSFASNLDLKCPEEVLYSHTLANLYGLDGDHTSAAVAWAIECFENGILTKEDTDGLELRWGKGDSIIQLIKNIAYRKGFGDILAHGVYEASKIIGKGSVKYTILVKKNSLMEANMRSHKAWALGIITSTKGAGHLRGAPGQERQKIPPKLSKKLFNIDNIYDPTSYEHKAELVTWHENYKGIIDMMGICVLLSMWNDVNLYIPDEIAEFYNIITGEVISPDKLLKIGSKLQNLERIFNLLHAGFDRRDDMPPEKLSKIPVKEGLYKGEKLDIDKWNNMLDEYYILHKWDKETGWPTKERLLELELDEVTKNLEENGIHLK